MDSDFIALAKRLKELPTKKVIALYKKSQNKRIIVARCYYDLKLFSQFFFSDVKIAPDGTKYKVGHTKDPFNKLHLDYFDDFDPQEKRIQKIYLAARGSAKTTLICLIDPLHRACYSTEKYQLILSSGAPLARAKSKDIHREVSMNDKLRHFYGLEFGAKRASIDSFLVKSVFGECFFHAQSFDSQIRGAKHGSERPTRVIYDDIVHGEEVFSEIQREQAKRKFLTDIKMASQPDTNHIMVGTTIHAQDLITEMSKQPTWKAKTYKAIRKWPKNMGLWDKWEKIWKDPTLTPNKKEEKAQMFYAEHSEKMNEGAEVLWPEREDLLFLMKERLTIGRREFGAEKQMEPFLNTDSLFQVISWYREEERDGVFGYYIEDSDKFIEYDRSRFVRYYALDPATGERKTQTQKKSLSQSARVIADRDIESGVVFLKIAIMDRKAPSKVIREMYDLHSEHDFLKMAFEENLYRGLFGEHIHSMKEKWANETGGGELELPFEEIYNKKPKEERIYSLEPLVSSGKILFNKYMNPDFLTQLRDYPNCDHNDGLDALEILIKVIDNSSALLMHKLSNYGRN